MKTSKKKVLQISPLSRKALAALQLAVKNLIEESRRSGRPLVIWADGKVQRWTPPDSFIVRETPPRYRVKIK
jgi:hypothetical protein